jgi:hypothetical protein
MDADTIIVAAEAWSREAYAPFARFCAVTTMTKREALLAAVRDLEAERDSWRDRALKAEAEGGRDA